jgi:hypothetical protein
MGLGGTGSAAGGETGQEYRGGQGERDASVEFLVGADGRRSGMMTAAAGTGIKILFVFFLYKKKKEKGNENFLFV